jgi:hypothetical protein
MEETRWLKPCNLKPESITDLSDNDLLAIKESLQTVSRMIFKCGLFRLGLEKDDEAEIKAALKKITQEEKRRKK